MREWSANARTWFRIRAHAAAILFVVSFVDITLHRHRDR